MRRLAGLQLLLILGFTAARGYASNQSMLGDAQGVTNTRLELALKNLEDRVIRIENTNPNAMVERVESLRKQVDNQQTLLWGIAVAVIVNLLTSNMPRYAPARRRQKEEDARRHHGDDRDDDSRADD